MLDRDVEVGYTPDFEGLAVPSGHGLLDEMVDACRLFRVGTKVPSLS